MALSNNAPQRPTGHAMNMAAPKRAPATLRNLIAEYKHIASMSRSQRLAHFLDWMAQRSPYQVIPANLAVQAIQGYARTPSPSKDEVKLLGNCYSAARTMLMNEHRRGLVVVRGLGLRATVDDQDCADTQQRVNVQRLVGAHSKVKETARIIDASKIADPKLREWVKGGVANAMRALEGDDRLSRLLPPPKPQEDEE